MRKTYHLEQLIKSREFRFDQFFLKDIDNEPVKRMFGSEMTEQETSLFHCAVSSGDEYFEILQKYIYQSMLGKKPAPVVRFADGEYAFYAYSMHCNGLYQQAESVESIKNSMGEHVTSLGYLGRMGKLAPLIFPGNVLHKKKTLLSLFSRSKGDNSALKFIEFLCDNSIALSRDNYLPFYVVYAYLTSKLFCKMVDGRNVNIVSSEYNKESCCKWFDRFSSRPNISFTEIPDRYVATQWTSIKEDVLERITSDAELCLVGAGIGSLLVCVDVANKFSIPAIDAGHVLNMMNGCEEKSGGARLYTMRRID